MSIVEIAKKFKVSSVTVSNALNYRKGVAEKLAEEIRAYADSVGYRPNFMARSLLSGCTGIVGVCLCVPPSTPWYGQLLCRLQLQLSEANLYATTIVLDPFQQQSRDRNESWALNFFSQIKAEAVLLGPCDLSRYRIVEKEYPETDKLIVFDSTDRLSCPHLMLDLIGGTGLAMQRLFDAGHRRIGYLGLNTFDLVNPSKHTRYSAYRQFQIDRQLPFEEGFVIPADDAEPAPEACVLLAERLRSSDRPTAFLCHNDSYAMLAIKVANQLNIRVPDDLSLIGFDDMPGAWLLTPELTTIKFDLNTYITRMVAMTTAVVEGKAPEAREYCENAILVERGSVAAIR